MLMKNSLRLVFALLGFGAVGAHAQSVRVAARSDSKLWLEGTSNLRGWSCRASTLDAWVEAASDRLPADPSALVMQLENVTVRVPVESLKCGNGRMERSLYKALSADDPRARIIVGHFNVLPTHARPDMGLRTVGTLTVAGRERTLGMEVRTHRAPDGTLVAEGAVPVLMTDFGIAPPTAFFGALRTGNRVLVHFELHVSSDAIVSVADTHVDGRVNARADGPVLRY